MFSFLKKQLIDVIEWVESEKDLLTFRYPMEDREIQTGGKLTVRESQAAVFVNEGQVADVFKAGLYTLKTQNLPILTNLKNWDKGFESPFKSDVYFFSLREQIGHKWGTQNPITVTDPQLGALRIRAFGSYAFKIKDPVVFYKKLSGTSDAYRVPDCEPQMLSILVANMTAVIAASKVPFLQMAANQMVFSDQLKMGLADKFNDYGLELTQFIIENLSLPENVQEYLDKNASMNLVGDLKRYTQFQTAEAITKAAQNEGGGMAGIGAGVGVGAAIGQAMSQSFVNAQAPAAAPAATAAPAGEDVYAAIEKLHALKEKGILSQAEFDAKKAEMLKKI